MNKLFLIGNVVRDIELMQTSSDVSFCHFTLAVSRNYTNAKGERVTDFFNCTAWNSMAKTLSKYVKKGNKLAITGSIELGTYEDKDGVKHNTVDVRLEDVEFLTPKPSGTSSEDEEKP